MERMAFAQAFTLHRYGSFQAPYDTAMEFSGDLSLQLLNRTYLMFAAHARTNFVSTLYYVLENPPRSILLPLQHIRVPHYVSHAPAAAVKINFSPRSATPEFYNVEDLLPGCNISGPLSAGDLVLHNPRWVAAGLHNSAWDPGKEVFTNYPDWRVTGGRLYKYMSSTLAATILNEGGALTFSIPPELFLARTLPAVRGKALPNPYKNAEHGREKTQVWYGDYVGVYDFEKTNEFLSNFWAIREPLTRLDDGLANLGGGLLTVELPSNVSGPVCIAITGEVAFRPCLTLDLAELPHKDQKEDSFGDPLLNRLSPLMMPPIPTYEQLAFLSNYLPVVAQAIFVSHMSSDDSRYQAEVQVLQQFIAGMSVEPGLDIKTAIPHQSSPARSSVRKNL